MTTEVVFCSTDRKKIITCERSIFTTGYNCYASDDGENFTKVNDRMSWFADLESAFKSLFGEVYD